MDPIQTWLQKVNKEIRYQAKSAIRYRRLNPDLYNRHINLLANNEEFYRNEFDWLDLNKDNFLSIKEINEGEKKKAKLISDRVAGSDPEFPIKIDLRRINRKQQRKNKGLNFSNFVKAKLFYAEIWARTMMKLHDLGKEDGKICPEEWWHVAQQHRRMLKGYSPYSLEEIWEDYRHVDLEPYSYVLELDELRWVLDIIRRKWVLYHVAREAKM